MQEQHPHPWLAGAGGPPYDASAGGQLWCPWPGRPREGLVLPVRVGRDGGPSRRAASGPGWRSTSRGFYVPSWVDASRVEQRILEAGVVMPYGAGVTGWAALRWHGAVWFDGYAPDGVSLLPVPILTADHNIRSQAGHAVSEERRSLAELQVVDGLVVSNPLRSLTFEMRYAPSVREAVVAFGMTAYSDLVTGSEVANHAAVHTGWTGAPQLRDACPYLEENSWSPWEDRTSLVWQIDAELPRPLANHPIFDRYGNHIGTPDLFDEEAGMVVEYDGEVHLGDGRAASDKLREGRFRQVGLEYLTVRRGDTARRALLANRMDAVRRRARFAAPSARRWSLELPKWWIPTFTVEQRLGLTDRERAALLRLRRKVS